MINDTKVFFPVRVALTILAFQLTNLAKPIGVSFSEVCWVGVEMLLKCSGESGVIMKSVSQSDFSNAFRSMDQVRSRTFQSFSGNVLIDGLLCDGLKYPMKMESRETSDFSQYRQRKICIQMFFDVFKNPIDPDFVVCL